MLKKIADHIRQLLKITSYGLIGTPASIRKPGERKRKKFSPVAEYFDKIFNEAKVPTANKRIVIS